MNGKQDKPHNGRAGYVAITTWGSRKTIPHEAPARITSKRVDVGLHKFDRATGKCVDKRFPLANYIYVLSWYQLDGGGQCVTVTDEGRTEQVA